MLELTAIQKIVLAVAIVALGGSGAYMFVTRGQSAPPVAPIYQPPTADQQISYVVVQVAGAVKSPGIYQFPGGVRAYEAIQRADGFTDEADEESVNLAEVLKDGQKIVVGAKVVEPAPAAEVSAPSEAGPSPATPESIAPPSPALAPPVAEEPPLYPRPPSDSYAPPPQQPPLVNLNTTTQQELERVPGIGPVIAQRIVLYRARYGPFRRVEELMLIQGIGPRTFELLKPYVTLGTSAVQ